MVFCVHYLVNYMFVFLCRNMSSFVIHVTVAVLNFVLVVMGGDPPGHMQPIGAHAPPLPLAELDTFPGPIEFFDNYVKPSRPVVFRGAAKQFPSFDNWKNDDYLKKTYGKWRIQAEEGKKENRSLGVQDMSYRKFLSVYAKSDIYLVQDVLPPNPMTKEVFLPKCLLCGGYTDVISTAVMWFSSGGTKSVLHNDQFENINCLYDGSKELYMVDKKFADLVPIDVMDGGYSSVDVEKVDMYKYPTLGDLEWHLGKMEAGDCLYIPLNWYHHVNSSQTRNLAINIWWNRMYDLPKREECAKQEADLPSYDALINYKIADPIEQSRPILFDTFNERAKSVSREDFVSRIENSVDEMMQPPENVDFGKLFDLMDTNNDGDLTVKEVYDTPAKMLYPFVGIGAFVDSGPPEEFDQRDEL
uniref:JmjC domain-containing protein 7 n=1 Tax=Phallusia mammillata TaxID=59560 RepID=A0A6F9DET4_9ASCI|nr:jmjC domain-containing protein 7 [Phallusia mammillata]